MKIDICLQFYDKLQTCIHALWGRGWEWGEVASRNKRRSIVQSQQSMSFFYFFVKKSLHKHSLPEKKRKKKEINYHHHHPFSKLCNQKLGGWGRGRLPGTMSNLFLLLFCCCSCLFVCCCCLPITLLRGFYSSNMPPSITVYTLTRSFTLL